MKTVGVIGFFGVFVLFATLIALWRRANDWDGIPFSRRFFLAVNASRMWWLAYSVGILVVFMGRYQHSFLETFPVVLLAIGLATLFCLICVRHDECQSKEMASRVHLTGPPHYPANIDKFLRRN